MMLHVQQACSHLERALLACSAMPLPQMAHACLSLLAKANPNQLGYSMLWRKLGCLANASTVGQTIESMCAMRLHESIQA